MNIQERYELRSSIRSCTACDLHTRCNSPVPFSGPAPSGIAIVGEAPGKTEDEHGEPFIGAAGQELRKWLYEAGIDETRVAFVNAVCCYPDRTPTSKERDACRDNLRAQLSFISPEYVLVVGGVALSALFSASVRMGEIRGLWFRTNRGVEGLRALATWHPAAVLRNPALREQAVDDVRFFSIIANEQMDPPLNEWCVKCGDYPVEYRYELPLCERHKTVKWEG